MRPDQRVDAVLTSMRGKALSRNKNGRRLVLDNDPTPVVNRFGEVIGVECFVRLFEGSIEIPIDPHRVFLNPPTLVVDAHAPRDELGKRTGSKTLRSAPDEALWDVLWQSVTINPSTESIDKRPHTRGQAQKLDRR